MRMNLFVNNCVKAVTNEHSDRTTTWCKNASWNIHKNSVILVCFTVLHKRLLSSHLSCLGVSSSELSDQPIAKFLIEYITISAEGNELLGSYVDVGLVGSNTKWTCRYQRFGGTYCLHLMAMKIETECSCETLISTNKTRRPTSTSSPLLERYVSYYDPMSPVT
jgi:hypothetical protein